MSSETGGEDRKLTVAELLAQHGGESGSRPTGRRRRRADDAAEETAPQAIIDRVRSTNTAMRPASEPHTSSDHGAGPAPGTGRANASPASPPPRPPAARPDARDAQPIPPSTRQLPAVRGDQAPPDAHRVPPRPRPQRGASAPSTRAPQPRAAAPWPAGAQANAATSQFPAVDARAGARGFDPHAQYAQPEDRAGHTAVPGEQGAIREPSPAQHPRDSYAGRDYTDEDYTDDDYADEDDYTDEDYTDDDYTDDDYTERDHPAGGYLEDDYDEDEFTDEENYPDAPNGQAELLGEEEESRPHGGPSLVREWLGLVGLILGGVLGGAVLWLVFNWLWNSTSIVVAAVAAVVVIAAIVLLVRLVWRARSAGMLVLSLACGLVVTASPALLLFLRR